MFEEAQVCMVCGRPVDSDGQVYCSEACSTLDASTSPVPSGLTSPSLSATSSAYASPYLSSTTDAADVPALVPSALGHGHGHKYSISSSSASSLGWTTSEDLTDPSSIAIHDPTHAPVDPLCESTKSPQYLHPLHAVGGGMMQYARRPSSTNNRSMVPTLLRHSSGLTTSSPSSASSFGAGKSVPSPLYMAHLADGDDDAASSLCLSEDGDHQSYVSSEHARKRRNRASLPAYFSLLQSSHSSTSNVGLSAGNADKQSASSPSPSASRTRHWRTPSALAQLSRSLQLASPTTPRVSHATVSANAADFTHANSPTSIRTEREVLGDGFEALRRKSDGFVDAEYDEREERGRGRGRARTRDPEDFRSLSGRRSERSPERRPHMRLPRHHYQLRQADDQDRRERERERGRARMSAAQRARIDSVEKVAEWVSSSPVVSVPLRPSSLSQNQQRRNSSPQARRVKYEFVEALTRGLRGCAVESDDDGEDELDQRRRRVKEEEDDVVEEKENASVRGRRRVHELDVPTGEDAPGLGGGRSGLRGRGTRRVVDLNSAEGW